MTQAELDQQIARRTGERVATIRGMGFGVANPVTVRHDPEPYDRHPLTVDWDAVDAERLSLFP